MAFLVRIRDIKDADSREMEEWGALFRGVQNNQRELVREWLSTTPTQRKKSFRASFGRQRGDQMRLAGWGSIKIGPLTIAIIDRFSLKLAKSIFYNHFKSPFEGVVYTQHISLAEAADPQGILDKLISIAPNLRETSRCGKILNDQFSYRFNQSADGNIFYVIAGFSDQFLVRILALKSEIAVEFEAKMQAPKEAIGTRTEVRLAS